MYCNVINGDACLIDGRFRDFEFVMYKNHSRNMCSCSNTCSVLTMRGVINQFCAQMLSTSG
jgi:hypothetical protein